MTQSINSEFDGANPLDVQVGGNHYKKFVIQPIEFCQRKKIPYCESNVIKYVTRWRDKGGVEDLKKAIHNIELLIEMEGHNQYVSTK